MTHYIYLYASLLYKLHLILPLTLVFSILILIAIVRTPIQPQIKINNFLLSYISLALYVVIYIFFFLTLRIYSIGRTVDLKLMFQNLTTVFIDISKLGLYSRIIIYLVIIILLLIWVIIFIKIRKTLTAEIWKLYMYYMWIPKDGPPGPLIASSPYKKINYILNRKIVDNRLSFYVLGLHWKVWRLIYKIRGKPDDFIEVIITTKRSILILFPILLFYLILILEAYFNNFKIFYLQYYLPIFLVLILYIQIIENLSWYLGMEGAIIVERAYLHPKIIYVNIPEEGEIFLDAYISKNPKIYNIYNPFFNLTNALGHQFVFKNRFIRVPIDYNPIPHIIPDYKPFIPEYPNTTTHVFWNEHTLKVFEEKDIKEVNGKYFVEDPAEEEKTQNSTNENL